MAARLQLAPSAPAARAWPPGWHALGPTRKVRRSVSGRTRCSPAITAIRMLREAPSTLCQLRCRSSQQTKPTANKLKRPMGHNEPISMRVR
eukprot:5708958-Prymnesium_polylepis.1